MTETGETVDRVAEAIYDALTGGSDPTWSVLSESYYKEDFRYQARAAVAAMRKLAIVNDAILAEREACAALADELRTYSGEDGCWSAGYSYACETIAAAIRAREEG